MRVNIQRSNDILKRGNKGGRAYIRIEPNHGINSGVASGTNMLPLPTM
jgi:hypothetical protein